MIFLRKENDAQMSDFAFVKKAPSPCKKSFFKKKNPLDSEHHCWKILPA